MIYLIRSDYTELYTKCLYSMCIHLASCVRLPYVSDEKAWEQNSYTIQSYEGTDGTIYFDVDHRSLAGAYRASINRQMITDPSYHAMDLFQLAPREAVHQIENHVFPYMLIGFEKKGLFRRTEVVIPVATTGIWSEPSGLYSCHSDSDFRFNGGNYLLDLMKPLENLKEELIEDYESPEEEIQVAEYLFRKKRNRENFISRSQVLQIHDVYRDSEEFWTKVEKLGFQIVD